jgi:hypothetical protein
MEKHNSSVSETTLAHEIRTIYNSDHARAESLIESYLEHELKDCLPSDRLTVIEKLVHIFEGSASEPNREDYPLEQNTVSQLISLLLGKDMSAAELSADELMGKLSQSLNAVFDTLNQIIRVINTTLLGEKIEFATIRQIIGSNIEGEDTCDSLQNYLDQIREAFLVAHKAFQEAASVQISQILNELDPNRISAETEKGLKFGPLRKAENFDIYTEKFNACKRWFDSGRINEELLREFEKICQKLYKKKARGV